MLWTMLVWENAAMPMIPQMPPEVTSPGHHAVTMLTRLGLDLTPVNFELMTLLLDGRRADLRLAFAALKRPIAAEDWEGLARQFLPQHFVAAADLQAGLSLLRSLQDVCDALSRAETAFAEDGRALEKSKTLLAASAGMSQAQLAHVAVGMVGVNSRAGERLTNLLKTLARWLAVSKPDVADAPSADGVAPGASHVATSETPGASMPAAALVGGAVSSPVTLHGLAERSVLMGRLQDLHTGGQKLDGSSLMLCHLKGLDGYRGPDMLKARDFVLDTLGHQTQRLMGEGDLACWMSPEELGLLLDANNDLLLTDISQKLRRIVTGSVRHARRTVSGLPDLRCHIGCASAFGPVSPGQLYSSAKLALQRAEFADDDRLVINDLSGPLKVDRRYDALYGRRMQ